MIIDIVLTYAQGRGGLEDVLTTVGTELTNRGHEVRVFLAYKPQYEEWEKTLPHINYYGTKCNIKEENGETLANGYRKKIEELGIPDIILATHSPGQSYICYKALEFLGKNMPPILSWIHSMPEYFGHEELLNYSVAHLAISKYIGASIKNSIKVNSEIYYIGNPIDISYYNSIKKSNNKAKYSYIGRLSNNEKRLDVLFEALSMLKNDFDFELDIIGDGPDKEKLKKIANELKIDKYINWFGWAEEPWKISNDYGLLVLPSDYEGCSMITLESLGRGIPVIGSDCPGITDIVIDGENGWIFERGNSLQLYKLLKDIYNGNKKIPSTNDCIKSIEKFKKDNVIDKIETILLKYNSLYKNEKELRQLRKEIHNFILCKKYEIAEKLIKDYKSILGKDDKILNLESDLLIENNKLNEAYYVVNEGLKYNGKNNKLISKMGYLEFVRGEYLQAIKYYYSLLELTNDENIVSILNDIYKKIIENVKLDLEFIKEYDKVVGNIDFNSEEYEKFMYKKSKIYEYNGELDKALRGYKTIVINTKNEITKTTMLNNIQQMYEYIKYDESFFDKHSINIDINNKVSDSRDLISVCILSYKNLEYLFDTIDSILSQEYKNIELIIANDCNEEFEADKYKNYILKNNKGNIARIVIYKNDINLGIISNANKAISISKGKYIKFIGEDDLFYSKKSLTIMYNHISNENLGVLATNVEYNDVKMNKMKEADIFINQCREYLPYGRNSKEFFKILLKGNIIPAPGIIFKKSIFNEYGMFDEEYMLMEDYPYWLKLSKNGCHIGYIDVISVKYRIGKGVSSSVNRNKYYEQDLNKSNIIVEKYKDIMIKEEKLQDNLEVRDVSRIKYGTNIEINIKTILNGYGTVNIGNNVIMGYDFAPHFIGFYNMIQARYKDSSIEIGDNTIFSNDINIIAATSIKIGNDCLIGDRVTILDHDGHGIGINQRRLIHGKSEAINIGNNVLVGTGVTILKGVNIGDNSIIGANSVVTKDVMPNSIVGGNPAILIRYIE